MAVTKRDYADEQTWKHWTWSSESDVLMNGAFFVESGSPLGSKFVGNQYDKITAAPGGYAATMTRFAGALSCRVGRPC
ncbi:unnamed protein product [Ilex paraguariensis]|uniref:Pectate lyase n=1 Tax=Ilex paraguariensis TaxID=185542 RepID=A0ABC8U147_9AQUA